MKRITLSPQDDHLHIPPPGNPLWREGYHFNGYDPLNGVAVTASTGISPSAGVKSDFVMIHMQSVFLCSCQKTLRGEDFLQLDALKIEPLIPFERLRIRMKESFQETKNGNFVNSSENIEFDLYFDSKISPCGYSVERFLTDKGERYEQPGSLRGRIRIGEKAMDFKGHGIRDHSWETRDVSQWEKWYGLMGWLESGDAVTSVKIAKGDKTFCEGWFRTDNYREVVNMWMGPTIDSGSETYQLDIETSKEDLEITSRPISFVTIPTGETSTMTEILVELECDGKRGHGFLWYGGVSHS